jgi:hypothetical protein
VWAGQRAGNTPPPHLLLQTLYDALLETRIRLQQPLTAAARLPSAPVLESFCAADPRIRVAANGLRAEVTALLCDLLRLRE